jgi:hypothetical protein
VHSLTRIAVALDHQVFQEPYKVLHAAEVLLMLKPEGLAKWARYKGHAGDWLCLATSTTN